MPSANSIFSPANLAIIEDIKKELRLQGHYLTGTLEHSLHPHEISESGSVSLTAEAAAYIENLEKGIKPEHIGITAKSISEMTRYVELRMGYTGKNAAKVAIAILKKQQKEGNPTKSSYQFSETGFRTEAVQDVFYKNNDRYFGMVDQAAITSLDSAAPTEKKATI